MVNKIPEAVWQRENKYKENRFSVFHSTEHIVMRFIEEFRDPRQFYSEPTWRMWSPIILPVMKEIATHYQYANPEFPKVMLAKLKAGQKIDQHIDKGRSNLYVHKIHVPIITDPQVLFYEKKQSFYLQVNNAYEVNNIIPHGVDNQSQNDRVHLIFEMFDNVHPKVASEN